MKTLTVTADTRLDSNRVMSGVMLVADASCAHIRELLTGAEAPVLWLDGHEQPLRVVSRVLQQRRDMGQPVHTLHWVSHGSPGRLQVGIRTISRDTLVDHADDLSTWNIRRLALWSCRAGADGDFIAQWEELTGAKVWKSCKPIGLLEDGSISWKLSGPTTEDPLVLPVHHSAVTRWRHQLSAPSFNSAYTSVGGTQIIIKLDTEQAKDSPTSGTFDPTQFTVKVNGTPQTIGSVRTADTNGASSGYVIATLAQPLGPTDAVTIAYTNLAIEGTSGGFATSQADTVVTNRTLTKASNKTIIGFPVIPGLAGSGIGSTSDETYNLLSIIQKEIDNGKNYAVNTDITNFSDTAALQSQLDRIDFLYVPDLENSGIFNPDSALNFPAASKTALKNFVEGGGLLLVTGTDGNPDIKFLNNIFNLGLVDKTNLNPTTTALNSANAAGTSFAGGPSTLASHSGSNGFDASSLSLSAGYSYKTIYGTDDNANVGIFTIGLGSIIILGSDYFDNGHNTDWGYGAHANGASNNIAWTSDLLPLATTQASIVTTTPISTPQPSTGGDFTPIPVVIDKTPADPAPAGTNIQSTDNDGDGLREVITASDGVTVDGNRDGIPDVQQTEVAGLRLINNGAVGSDYGALVVSPDVRLSAVTLITPTAEGGIPVTARGGGTVVTTAPDGITNAFAGAVSFNVSGVTPGGTTQATISFPSGLPAESANAYLRFNYSTNRFEEYVDAAGNPLYSFVDSDGDGVFDAVKLTLSDGDTSWDGDGIANGTVVDPGFLGSGERNLTGTKRSDSLIGNFLANNLNGRKGNDWIVGDLGNDILKGSLGKDGIYGGEGADQITGDKDRDRIHYTSISDSTAALRDTVRFDKEDQFVFSSFDGDTTAEGLQGLTFIGNKTFSGNAGELRATRSVLEADTTGDGIADFAVNLPGNTLITANNLIL
jgi:hypothetical protein